MFGNILRYFGSTEDFLILDHCQRTVKAGKRNVRQLCQHVYYFLFTFMMGLSSCLACIEHVLIGNVAFDGNLQKLRLVKLLLGNLNTMFNGFLSCLNIL